MSEQGRKYDGGKLRYDLLPVLALEDVVKGLTYGTIKYDDNNWVKVPEGRKRYIAAAMRHVEKYRMGVLFDEESGVHHLSAAIDNLMFIVEKDLRGWEDIEEGDSPVEDISQEELKVYVDSVRQGKKKLWCETCEGVGHYDNRDFGIPREYYNSECPCPDCDGKGYIEV